MVSKATVRDLIRKCGDGNFQTVIETLRADEMRLETSHASKMIASCSTACYNNLATAANISAQYLVELVMRLMRFVEDPSETVMDNHFQSVFFILKLLLEQGDYEAVLELETVFMPSFMPIVLITTKQRNVYQSICSHLYNVIVKISRGAIKEDKCRVTKLCYLLSRMCKRLDQSIMLDKAYNCTICLDLLEVDENVQYSYYIYVLDLLDECDSNNQKDYILLMKFYCLIIANLVKNRRLETVNVCCTKTADKSKKIFDIKTFTRFNNIIEICMWLNPFATKVDEKPLLFMNYHNKFRKMFNELNGKNNDLETICVTYSVIIFRFVAYYRNVDCTYWIAKSITDQLHFYQFLFDISQIFSQYPHKCPCTCNLKTNLNESVRMLLSIGILSKLYLLNNRDDNVSPLKILDSCTKYLTQCYVHVKTLKQINCTKWKSSWYELGEHLYNIGFCLYKKNDDNKLASNGLEFLTKFASYVIELEANDANDELVIKEQYLTTALTAIAEIHSKLKDYRKALVVTAYNIAMSKGSRDSEICRWLNYKIMCKKNDTSIIIGNDDIQELTLVSALEMPPFAFTTTSLNIPQQIELLTLELESYKSKWRSKRPMMATYRHLIEIETNPFNLAKIFVDIWGECDLSIHDDIPTLLQTTIDECEKQRDLSNHDRIYLAYLYYLHYTYCLKRIVRKNCEEVEHNITIMKSVNENTNPPGIVNENCDIVSCYEPLHLDRALELMKYIEMASNMIRTVVTSDDFTLDSLGTISPKQVHSLLKQIAYEYRLHCNVIFALQAWELAFHVAKVAGNDLDMLQALSFIVEASDVTRDRTQCLINEADAIVDRLLLYNNSNYYCTVIIYFISKTVAYFYRNFDMAYSSFKRAMTLYEAFSKTGQDDIFLKIRLDLLHHKFIMLPCHYGVDGHREFSLIKIHTAVKDAKKHYINQKYITTSYTMSLLFEVTEELIKICRVMRLPREIKCHGRDMVILAQKMVIPLRTAYLLENLAYADLNCCNYDDCKVKIQGISNILCMSKRTLTTPVKSPRKTKQPDTDLATTMDSLNLGFREMMLDVPTQSHYGQSSCGSPTSVVVETFRMPSFLRHDDNCQCFYCISLEYQQYVLKKTYLDALLSCHLKRNGVAQEFFIGCLKMFEVIKSKQKSYMMRRGNYFSFGTLSNYLDDFVEVYCYVLLEFCNHLLRCRKKNDAKKMNRELIQLILPRKLELIYLYNESLSQELNIISLSQPKETKDPNRLVVQEYSSAHSDGLSRTPENKLSEVSIPIRISPGEAITPRRRIVKAIKFDLSAEEATNLAASPAVASTNNQLTDSTPSSKIKIYTESTKKVKKPIAVLPDDLAQPPPPESTVDDCSNFLIPRSPNAYTPNVATRHCPKSEHRLRSRTKLLTEKLKGSSTKKSSKCAIGSVNGESEEGIESHGIVRKNLLADLTSKSTAATGGDGGRKLPVRKTRSRTKL